MGFTILLLLLSTLFNAVRSDPTVDDYIWGCVGDADCPGRRRACVKGVCQCQHQYAQRGVLCGNYEI